MDTQVCKICGEVKSIDNFSIRKYPSGVESPRKDCKECRSKKEVKRQNDNSGKLKPKVESPVPVLENQVEIIAPMEKIQPIRSNKSGVPALTDDEILSIRAMINNQFADSVHGDRSKRVPRTFNMDVAVVDWLKRKARESDTSTSDIINSALHKLMNDS